MPNLRHLIDLMFLAYISQKSYWLHKKIGDCSKLLVLTKLVFGRESIPHGVPISQKKRNIPHFFIVSNEFLP